MAERVLLGVMLGVPYLIGVVALLAIALRTTRDDTALSCRWATWQGARKDEGQARMASCRWMMWQGATRDEDRSGTIYCVLAPFEDGYILLAQSEVDQYNLGASKVM